MAFKNTILEQHAKLPAGEFLSVSPHNVSAFENFEDGIIAGEFVAFDDGVVDTVGATAANVIGVARRRIAGEIGPDYVYSRDKVAADHVVEVVNFGFVTVKVAEGEEPKQYDVVQATADGAKVSAEPTTDINALTNVVFWQSEMPGVWLVRIGSFL